MRKATDLFVAFLWALFSRWDPKMILEKTHILLNSKSDRAKYFTQDQIVVDECKNHM